MNLSLKQSFLFTAAILAAGLGGLASQISSPAPGAAQATAQPGQLRFAAEEPDAVKAAKPANWFSHAPAVPILIYHKTPANFESQLQLLLAKGYTAISLDELIDGWHHGAPLPPKPVLITFDDGFADQVQAFNLLIKYNLKATFYIMPGGAASQWCLGPNRTNLSCGEAYLSWQQVIDIDNSGLVKIEAHTVDHLNLARLNPADALHQLTASKAELEARLGRPVRHMAYPYGQASSTTVALALQAGYVSAVTTRETIAAPGNNMMLLPRVRNVAALP
jgi:poly-beta-1,6-N-acetyl-D-glucosamine N-deacetylase